jgi:hypothetical protein
MSILNPEIMKEINPKPVLFFAVVLALVLAGCTKDTAASLYVPSASDVTTKATLADLQQGRTLYINDCGRCHGLYQPESYSPSQWKSLLPGMTSKTSLTAAEIVLVTKYVTKGQQ